MKEKKVVLLFFPEENLERTEEYRPIYDFLYCHYGYKEAMAFLKEWKYSLKNNFNGKYVMGENIIVAVDNPDRTSRKAIPSKPHHFDVKRIAEEYLGIDLGEIVAGGFIRIFTEDDSSIYFNIHGTSIGYKVDSSHPAIRHSIKKYIEENLPENTEAFLFPTDLKEAIDKISWWFKRIDKEDPTVLKATLTALEMTKKTLSRVKIR